MNEYLSSGDITPIDRVSRSVSAVSGVLAGTGVGSGQAGQENQSRSTTSSAGADIAAGSEEHLASAAEYARVHARIADILADLRSGQDSSTAAQDTSLGEITGLMPQPVIVVPLPPATRDMVERAVLLAREIASQAAASRAAQAHVKPGTVDQILAAVA